MKGFRQLFSRFHFDFLTFPKSVLSRPFKTFDALKYEKKSSWVFCIFVLLFSVMMNILTYVYQGFLINRNNPYEISSLYLALVTLFPVSLFVIGNWCITTLMNGKGKLGEIFQVTMYALYPFCVAQLIALGLSNVLTLDEISAVSVVTVIGAVLFVLYLFIGLTVIHEYTFSQCLGSLLLTLLAMMILVFILMLLFTLWSDVFDFITVVYKELRLKGL